MNQGIMRSGGVLVLEKYGFDRVAGVEVWL